ncbi:Protein phosphatase 2C (PP2C)-like domain [Macleaya cordata]|uniref:Protein phosphatase n=1 Tax=Macleaya cordata TaxID=56857 RepID=A0A200R7K2_MACCD|nr:Protein phosphatase 2C (PP2C)-like domain [Macleaya cordata]
MPSYFSRLNLAFKYGSQNPILGKQGGKLLFGSSGLCLSQLISTIGDVHSYLWPSSVSAANSDSPVVNEQRNLSVVEALSRSLSSGSSFQLGEYYIDHLLSNSTKISLASPFQEAPMAAASGSKALLGDCCLDSFTLKNGHLSNSAKQVLLSYSNRSLDSCSRASMSLRNQKPCNDNLVYGYFLFDVLRRSCNYNPLMGLGWKGFHSSSSTRNSVGASPDASFHGSGCEEQLASTAVSSDQKTLGDRTLMLLSGSCYLPHPAKEETGGEDAHFICIDEQAIGVADGVGGWADVGINAGLFAQELMSNSVNAIVDEPKGSIDPARVLEKAHSSTKAKGSSTACIIALTDQGLHAINLGDSGFIVVRDGCTVFRSPVQQHGFNFTYQLESGNTGDLPSSGQVVFNIPVAPGDVIVAGTDGLFDNLYNNEITAVVVDAMRTGLEPQATAQKIAALARQRALDKNRQTPFSTAAQDAGFRYYGGKLDDITVVVSYITNSTNV